MKCYYGNAIFETQTSKTQQISSPLLVKSYRNQNTYPQPEVTLMQNLQV